MNIKRTLTIIIVLALAASCSPSARLARLVKKHPELVRVDTLYIHDTIIVEGVKYDTVTRFLTNTTVEVINNERMRLEYHYDTITNEIRHSFECKEITIHKEHRIPYNFVQPTEPTQWWIWLIGIGVLVLFVYDRFIR
jgi:hypothetical protein